MNNIYINPNDSLFQQYQQFLQQQQNVDHYSKLENELKTLSDKEVSELASYKPYNETNGVLTMVVQAELLKLIRSELNRNPEVINNVISAVRDFKALKNKEKSDFEDYIKNYSHLTYADYTKLKNEKG